MKENWYGIMSLKLIRPFGEESSTYMREQGYQVAETEIDKEIHPQFMDIQSLKLKDRCNLNHS